MPSLLGTVGEAVDQAWKENVPMDARIFLEALLGDRSKEITEDRFTREELGQMESEIQRSVASDMKRLGGLRGEQEELRSFIGRAQRTVDNLPRLLPQLEEASRTDPEWIEYRGAEGTRKGELYGNLLARYGGSLDDAGLQLEKVSDRKDSAHNIFELGSQAFREKLITLDEDMDVYRDMIFEKDQRSSMVAEEIQRLESGSGDLQYHEYEATNPYISRESYTGPPVGTTLGRATYSLDSPDQRVITETYDFDEGYSERYRGLGKIDKAIAVARQLYRDFNPDHLAGYFTDESENVNTPGTYGWKQMIGQVLGEAYIGDEGPPVNIRYPISSVLGTMPE